MKNLRKIAEQEGLDYIETTSERNGYPSNIEGAIKGFETFQEAEEIADKYNLQIELFSKKDGWALWFRTGSIMRGPLLNSSTDYGDDYSEIPYDVYDPSEERDFIRNKLSLLIEDVESFDELKNIVKSQENLWEEVQKLEEGDLIITYLGGYYETIKQESMYFYHDTRHSVIGLIDRS